MVDQEDEVLDLTKMNTLAANRGQSTVRKPVRAVHTKCAELLAANPSMRRKDLIQACVDSGITYYTARTQVQEFLKAHRGGIAPEALQPEPEPVEEDPDTLCFDGQALLFGGMFEVPDEME